MRGKCAFGWGAGLGLIRLCEIDDADGRFHDLGLWWADVLTHFMGLIES